MSEKFTEGSEKRSEGLRMTTINDAARMLRELAEPRPVGDKVKSAITRAARRVSAHLREPMSYGRAEDIWRREARRIDAAEMDAIRAAREDAELRAEVQKAQGLAVYLEGLATSTLAPRIGAGADEIRAAADEARKVAHTLRRLAAAPDGR